jgi:hypothetical protein
MTTLAKGTIGPYKTELIKRRGSWKTIDQVELTTLGWVQKSPPVLLYEKA